MSKMIFPRFSFLFLTYGLNFCLLVNKLHTRKSLSKRHEMECIHKKRNGNNQYLGNACELATWGMNKFLSDSLQTPFSSIQLQKELIPY